MRVFVTGGTGFIGRKLVKQLSDLGHTPAVWTRSPDKARSMLGPRVEVLNSVASIDEALAGSNAVVNLAGEPVLPGRWSPARKKKIVESRVDLTQRLVDGIGRQADKPTVLVSASGVGYYGEGPIEAPCPETAGPGADFLARLCVDWESAARAATDHGVRVTCLRIGFVLGVDGGALGQMLGPFKAGLGGRIGSGRQPVPWIHVTDLVRMIVAALIDERFPNVVNGAAPNPVSNAEFTSTLGRVLGRPTVIPVPSAALRLAFGEAAGPLLGGQNAVPEAAQSHGFEFEYRELEACLRDVLSKPGNV